MAVNVHSHRHSQQGLHHRMATQVRSSPKPVSLVPCLLTLRFTHIQRGQLGGSKEMGWVMAVLALHVLI